jgi:L-fuculose-phosphate aldolase
MTQLPEATIAAIVRKTLSECLMSEKKPSSPLIEPLELFDSPATLVLKNEIVEASRKLWNRQYVDGNGGNLSVRLSPEYVLCTPTLLSKADVRVEDLTLVNLANERICGTRFQTSEIRLHLEIYKAVPQATAVIHCHPPYATAHAIAGMIPQGNLLPEQEVFVGPLAITPYETPGTWEFARTVLPVVQQHNTILLANHGVVCWADSVTHAEWFVEVVETYCKTVTIASQLRTSLPEIPPAKIDDLLAIKKSLGLPDARFSIDSDAASDHVLHSMPPSASSGAGDKLSSLTEGQTDLFVSRLASEIANLIQQNR